MRDDEQPETVGELVDMIPPGETIHLGGFEIRRWPDPEPPTRAERRGNRDRHAYGRPGLKTRRPR